MNLIVLGFDMLFQDCIGCSPEITSLACEILSLLMDIFYMLLQRIGQRCLEVALAAFLIPYFIMNHLEMPLQTIFAGSHVRTLIAAEILPSIMNCFNMLLQHLFVSSLKLAHLTRVLLDTIVNCLDVLPEGVLVCSLEVTLVAEELLFILMNSLHMKQQ